VSTGFDVNSNVKSISGLSADQIELAVKSVRSDSGFIGLGSAFVNLEKTYGVNAYFAIGVAGGETGHGTKIISGTNNLYNIKGTGTAGKSGEWAAYNTKEDSIEAFGKLITSSKNYFAGGNTTPATIGTKYDPGNSIWASFIVDIMNMYAKKLNYANVTPASSAPTGSGRIREFIDIAMSHKDETPSQIYDWLMDKTGYSSYNPWCAAFVWACAKSAGLSNTIIFASASSTQTAKMTVKNYNGEIYAAGKNVRPKPGDLWFAGNLNGSAERADFSHIGIVASVESDGFMAIHGNWSKKVSYNKFKWGSPDVGAYLTPNWSVVGDTPYANDAMNAGIELAYVEQATREDATVREVGYLNSSLQPTTTKTGIRLGMINYPSVLKYSTVTTNLSTSSMILDNLEQKPRIVVEFFRSKGLCDAAGVAVAANIKGESGFNTAAVGDNNTSFGICQWHKGRGDSMKKFVGSDWANNLTGQLEYLWEELKSSYNPTYTALLNAVNSLDGAYIASDVFVDDFERPADRAGAKATRRNYAAELWGMLVPLTTEM
jgi:hypothetical protein